MILGSPVAKRLSLSFRSFLHPLFAFAFIDRDIFLVRSIYIDHFDKHLESSIFDVFQLSLTLILLKMLKTWKVCYLCSLRQM